MQQTTLEKIAPTVEQAVEEGLQELGLRRDQVEVEVIDGGSKGLFGLGNREVRVLLRVLPEETENLDINAAFEKIESVSKRNEDVDVDFDFENACDVTKETVEELLDRMDVRAKVNVQLGESDNQYMQPILVEIVGNDLSILIGRKAETLDALQYITRLIVGKELGRSVSITIDVEGYRVRREINLRKLAQRMASQAVSSGRKQSLEPMPANERRIIHLELRDNESVSTESWGDEPRRKVVIIPKF
jgi:spoIIIJ-associated protein